MTKALCGLVALALHLVVLAILAVSGLLGESRPVANTPAILINLADFREAPPAGMNHPKTTQSPSLPVAIPTVNSSPAIASQPAGSISPESPDSRRESEAAAPTTTAPKPEDPLAGLADQVRNRIQAKLQYPEAARRRGVSGVVRLDIILAPNGQAVAIRVQTSSGSAILDKAAVALAGSVLPIPMAQGISGNTSVRINVNYTLPH